MEPIDSSPEGVEYMFEEREKVLCFQGPLIYEAKVLLNKSGQSITDVDIG